MQHPLEVGCLNATNGIFSNPNVCLFWKTSSPKSDITKRDAETEYSKLTSSLEGIDEVLDSK